MKFLIINDTPSDCELILWILQKKFRNSEFIKILRQQDFDEAITRCNFDVVITNYRLDWTDGQKILNTIHEHAPYAAVVVIAEKRTGVVASEGTKTCLSNFILKKHIHRLPEAVRESQEKARLLKIYDQTNRRYYSLMDYASDAIFITDTDGNLLEINKKAEELTGYSKEELVNMNFIQLHPKEELEKVTAAFKEEILKGTGLVSDTLLLKKDGKTIPIDLTRSVIEHAGERIVQTIVRDTTKRKLSERRLSMQYATTRILAESDTIYEATPKILQTICEGLEWDLGALWTVNRKTNILRCSQIWHKPSVEVPEFEAVTRNITFPQGIGLPGRVWSSGMPSWITDVAHDTNFPRAPIAIKEGLHGALGFPIRIGTEILGVIEFFSHEIQQPDEDLLNLMGAIGSQIGQFIERKLAEESLRCCCRKRNIGEAGY